MASLGFNVDVNDLPQDNGGDFSPIPAGQYTARIADASIETTKSGTGQYIKLRLDVTGPTHEGRVLFSNLNIKNDSQKAEEIGRQQLGAIMRAINVPNMTDTDQLIGGNVSIKIAIRAAQKDDDGNVVYDAQNEVKAYKAIEGSSAPMPTAGASAPAAQAPTAAKPPWQR
jgi:hypothetical protein